MTHPPSRPNIEVEISDTQGHVAVDPEALEALIRHTLISCGIERATISIAIVDDAEIQAINRRFLDHDWPTDVITFPLPEADATALSGELVVSAETAAATAAASEVPPWPELALYVVHGLLHLCGYDDQTPGGRESIRRREGEILAGAGLINTFPLAGPDATATEGRESMRWAV